MEKDIGTECSKTDDIGHGKKNGIDERNLPRISSLIYTGKWFRYNTYKYARRNYKDRWKILPENQLYKSQAY